MLPAGADSHNPVLLHGDLTDENVLGRVISCQSRSSRRQLKAAGNGAVHSSVVGGDQDGLRALLKSIGCEKYTPILVDREELTVETLALLDDNALKELGIPLGHRLAILKAKDHTTLARVEENDEDRSGAVSYESEWETASSSSSDSDEEDELAPANADAAAASRLEELQEKRQARFYGTVDWEPTCVIDFADAKSGDPLYDLVAILFAALVSVSCCFGSRPLMPLTPD